MPFGLSNSPSAYCRLVQMALDRLPPGFAVAYLDDILIYSSNIKDHLIHLEQVLKIHAEVGMKLNLNKCKIFREKVVYLGHEVSHQGVQMVPEYVEKIRDWPIPKTGKELISFLGFTSYYRAFIPEYAKTVACLNKYRNEKEIKLSKEEQNQINYLKGLFLKSPIRSYPLYYSENPFIIDTDFSSLAVGGVLSQVQGELERFIGCFSRSLNSAQSKYPAHKGELMAVILALRKYEHILRAKKFLIRTDSSAITYLQGLKEARGIWARWLIYLASFDFDIVHRPGRVNTAADALSRTSFLPSSKVNEDENQDDYLLYPDIDDIYLVGSNESSTDPFNEMKLENWKLETKKDYPLSLIMGYIKSGKLPLPTERRQLPRSKPILKVG